MIVDYRSKVIYVTPPRTGSRSMHHWLCNGPGHHAVWVVGPSFGTAMDHHTVHSPMGTMGFKWLCVTRDPVERLLSLYGCLCEHYVHTGHQPQSLEVYLERVRGKDPTLHPMYYTSIQSYQMLSGQVYNGMVRSDHMAEDVIQWSPWANPERLQQRGNSDRPQIEELSPELQDMVRSVSLIMA